MALTIPPHQAAGIKALLELPENSTQELLAGLASAEPQFNASDLALKVTESTQLPRQVVTSITSMLIGLYRTLSERVERADFGKFLDLQILPALRMMSEETAEKSDEQWQKFRAFLLAALDLKTVDATAKAGPVLTEHERIFQSVKIMTDLRPIWASSPTTEPDSALIIHMLKITQRDKNGRQADFYFALDSNDIIALKGAIVRAEQKESSLRELMKKTNITVLHTKANY